jgi:uncharacterized C2H2 Zn-finger protein
VILQVLKRPYHGTRVCERLPAMGKAKISCPTCGQTFTRLSSLKNHLAYAHSNRRGYTCRTCREHFKQQKDLTRHQSSHSANGSKAWACDGTLTSGVACTYRSARSHDLNRHLKSSAACRTTRIRTAIVDDGGTQPHMADHGDGDDSESFSTPSLPSWDSVGSLCEVRSSPRHQSSSSQGYDPRDMQVDRDIVSRQTHLMRRFSQGLSDRSHSSLRALNLFRHDSESHSSDTCYREGLRELTSLYSCSDMIFDQSTLFDPRALLWKSIIHWVFEDTLVEHGCEESWSAFYSSSIWPYQVCLFAVRKIMTHDYLCQLSMTAVGLLGGVWCWLSRMASAIDDWKGQALFERMDNDIGALAARCSWPYIPSLPYKDEEFFQAVSYYRIQVKQPRRGTRNRTGWPVRAGVYLSVDVDGYVDVDFDEFGGCEG